MNSSDKYTVITSGVASVDIIELAYYLSIHEDIDTATRILSRIYKSIESLDMYPNRYKEIEIEGIKFREMIVDKFRILYTVDSLNYVVVIERMLYTGRDISKIAIG